MFLARSFFLPTGDLLFAFLPAPPVNLLRRSNEVFGEFLWSGDFLLGPGDGDRDNVEESDFSLVTDLRLRLLGDLDPLFSPLSLDLDDLRLLGDLESVFFPLTLDLDDLRLREEDLCL